MELSLERSPDIFKDLDTVLYYLSQSTGRDLADIYWRLWPGPECDFDESKSLYLTLLLQHLSETKGLIKENGNRYILTFDGLLFIQNVPVHHQKHPFKFQRNKELQEEYRQLNQIQRTRMLTASNWIITIVVALATCFQAYYASLQVNNSTTTPSPASSR